MKIKKICLIIILFTICVVMLYFHINKAEQKTSNTKQYNKIINNKDKEENKLRIEVMINEKAYTATLLNNETSRELVSRFPLEFIMNDLNKNEKYYYLNKELPNNPIKIKNIQVGDIMLYGDDCLVLFYESFANSYSYTKIGEIDNPGSLKEMVGTEIIKIKFTNSNN